MNYRTAKLLAETNKAAAGTTTIDLNLSDIVSRLIISWRVTKSKHGMDAAAHKDITKIELVDGSDVLHSLSGGENQALCIYDRKAPTMNHGQHSASNSEFSSYGIDFGRFLFDPMFAFDPKRFRNPQLKITHNHAVSDTGATSGNLEVIAECFDQKQVSPAGFFMAKELYAYTCGAANSYEYINLPRDQTVRRILIEAYRSQYTPWDQIIEARLDEDNEKRIPFDWDLEDYHRFRKGMDPMVQETFVGMSLAAATGFYVTPTDYYAAILPVSSQALTSTPAFSQYMPGGYCSITANANSWLYGIAVGYLPNHCFNMPMGDPANPEDWFDPAALTALRLRLKAGASGTSGTGAVVLQQVRRY